MNSYALLEDLLEGIFEREYDDQWKQVEMFKSNSDSSRSECGWTNISGSNASRRNSEFPAASFQYGSELSINSKLYSFQANNHHYPRRLSNYSIQSDETDLIIRTPYRIHHGSLGVYLSACKRYNQIPHRIIQENLNLQTMILSNQSLSDSDIKALSVALAVNECVSHLDVSNNRISIYGLQFIKHMILTNSVITHLNISNNKLGSMALKYLAVIVDENHTLLQLHAQGNGFGPINTYTEEFTRAVQNSVTLRQLNMGYNQFGSEGGPVWAAAIAGNYGLKELVLRWNHLRWQGAMIILEALIINDTLTLLDLAWNGLGDEGAAVLSHILRHNNTLEELDLTCNRITCDGAIAICEGLRYNDSLQILKMNKNPITTAGACAFLLEFESCPKSALKRLELLDIEVDREFESLLADIQASPRPLEVIHGGHVIQGDLYMDKSRARRTRLGDPLMVLFEHVKTSNLRLWDLFAQLDKDKSLSISREEFRNGMREAELPLDDHQIERIMDTLDKDKNGEISFEELLEGHKRYRERERKKYEVLLPFILQRPSSARNQGSDGGKDFNAPMPREKVNPTLSMSGYNLGVGGGGSKPQDKPLILRPRLSLPSIHVTAEDNTVINHWEASMEFIQELPRPISVQELQSNNDSKLRGGNVGVSGNFNIKNDSANVTLNTVQEDMASSSDPGRNSGNLNLKMNNDSHDMQHLSPTNAVYVSENNKNSKLTTRIASRRDLFDGKNSKNNTDSVFSIQDVQDHIYGKPTTAINEKNGERRDEITDDLITVQDVEDHVTGRRHSNRMTPDQLRGSLWNKGRRKLGGGRRSSVDILPLGGGRRRSVDALTQQADRMQSMNTANRLKPL